MGRERHDIPIEFREAFDFIRVFHRIRQIGIDERIIAEHHGRSPGQEVVILERIELTFRGLWHFRVRTRNYLFSDQFGDCRPYFLPLWTIDCHIIRLIINHPKIKRGHIRIYHIPVRIAAEIMIEGEAIDAILAFPLDTSFALSNT